MKRSGPPQRKTPLRSTGKIKQAKPLSHEWPEASRVPQLPPKMKRSPSRGKRAISKKIPAGVRSAVVKRSGGYCEAAVTATCRRRGGHLHHKLMRSQGGKHTEANLVDVCGNCHLHIHTHPEWAYEHGWLVRRPAV